MSDRQLTITHNGTEYSGKIGRIAATHLGPEGHGIFTAQLTVEGDGWGVGVGGYILKGDSGFGIDHISAIMKAVGVETWEKVRGNSVMVLFGAEAGFGNRAVGIAHPVEDRVLIFAEHAEQYREREDENRE